MLKLVAQIEEEESERKKILNECTNEEEKLKLRQKFLEKKAESQKKVKKLMEKHKKEAEYLDKEEMNLKLKELKLAQGDAAVDHEGGEEEHLEDQEA